MKAVQLSRFDPDRLDCRKIKALYVGASGWVIVQAWTLQETFLAAMFAVHRNWPLFSWLGGNRGGERRKKEEKKKKSAHCSVASLQTFSEFTGETIFLVKTCKCNLWKSHILYLHLIICNLQVIPSDSQGTPVITVVKNIYSM